MTPTHEQLAIIDAAKNTTDNLLISALAGAAKTSTLILVAESLKSVPTLCLAFNKKIAEEMKERLPGNCEAMTLNSLGHRAWGSALGKRLILDTSKTYNLLTAHITSFRGDDKSLAYERFNELMQAVDFAKTRGWIPEGTFTYAKRLLTDDEYSAILPEELSDFEFDLVRKIVGESIHQSLQGTIDFNDQILMPTLFPNASFTLFPLVLVDEAQDLSELNHKMLQKLAKKRIIAVGDACQAIYAFRGASTSSMKDLKDRFQMKEFTLSISFRCPIAVVKAAQWRAPHMRWPEWAKEGTVRTLTSWNVHDLPDNAAIICRNNAPLFRQALALLKARRYPQLIGNDIGKNLLKIMKKFGSSSMPKAEVIENIVKWKMAKLAKTRSPGSIHDQADCMLLFAEEGDNLGDALAYAEHIFNARGPIQLMTGHKSKGLEFDHVFILDKHLIGDSQQEDNLRYVMQTRAKQTLTYVDSEGWSDGMVPSHGEQAISN